MVRSSRKRRSLVKKLDEPTVDPFTWSLLLCGAVGWIIAIFTLLGSS